MRGKDRLGAEPALSSRFGDTIHRRDRRRRRESQRDGERAALGGCFRPIRLRRTVIVIAIGVVVPVTIVVMLTGVTVQVEKPRTRVTVAVPIERSVGAEAQDSNRRTGRQ